MVVKPDAIILRQHHPISLSDVAKPCFVFRILRKMIVMNFCSCTGGAQRIRNGFFAERTVDKENNLVKRL